MGCTMRPDSHCPTVQHDFAVANAVHLTNPAPASVGLRTEAMTKELAEA